jgi:hypothetical protein
MKKYLTLFAAFAALGFCMNDASAMSFSMGTHGSDVIKSACSKAGGTYGQGSGGGYGCEYSNGSEVLCDKHGKCTGYTALQGAGGQGGRLSLSGTMKMLAASSAAGTSPNAGSAPLTTRAQMGTGAATMNTNAAAAANPLNNGTALNVSASRATVAKQPH